MKKSRLWIYLAVIIFLTLLLVIPFILTFWNTNLSPKIEDWGAFGSYFSIIVSVANLIVFVYLTIYISNLDEERNKNQIASQYKITITQFRQTEIIELSNRLNRIFENFGTEPKSNILGNLNITSLYLNNFLNEKLYLFPILESEKMKHLNDNFQSICDQLISFVDKHHGTNLSEEFPEKLETNIKVLFITRSVIIKELQNFMLEDLKK
jgi:uncharacterized membrane protein